MPNLDGKDVVKPTPFDAHEQNVRNSGEYQYQEFPKAVDHVPHPDPVAAAAGQLEPIVVTEEPAVAPDAEENA